MTEHNLLTGAALHEPKGVAAATEGQVYIADGAGSGVWTHPTYVVTGFIPDISTADSVLVPVPISGTVTNFQTVLGGAITIADADVSLENSASDAMATLTVEFTGSALGDVDSTGTITNASVSDNDYLVVATDGGSTTAAELWFSITIQRDD